MAEVQTASPPPVLPTRARWRWMALVGPLPLLLAGVFLPSQNLHVDGLDELSRLEEGGWSWARHHPAAELLIAFLAVLFREGARLVRPVQLWNLLGCWTALAALGWRAGWRSHSGRVAAGVGLLGGGLMASLSLATDPALFFVSPGLALGVLAWTWSELRPTAFYGPVLLTVAASLFLPPVAVVGWMVALRRKRDAVRTVVAGGLPGGTSLALAQVIPEDHTPPGDYGLAVFDRWASVPDGVSGLVLADPVWTGGPLLRLGAWALCSSVAGLAIVGLAGLVRGRESGGVLAGWFATMGFAVFWDPGQSGFWLLPALLILPAVVQRLPMASIVVGACLTTVNVGWSVLPAAVEEDPRRRRAEVLSTRLGPTDLVVSPGWPDTHLHYFGNLDVTGLRSVAHAHPDAPLGGLEMLVREQRDLAGRTWLVVAQDGSIVAPADVARHYPPGSLAGLVLGERLEVEGLVLRELQAVK